MSAFWSLYIYVCVYIPDLDDAETKAGRRPWPCAQLCSQDPWYTSGLRRPHKHKNLSVESLWSCGLLEPVWGQHIAFKFRYMSAYTYK